MYVTFPIDVINDDLIIPKYYYYHGWPYKDDVI